MLAAARLLGTRNRCLLQAEVHMKDKFCIVHIVTVGKEI